MSRAGLCLIWGCALQVWLSGCSPSLNWREVQVDRLQVFLPCKPDRATRTVQLEASSVPIEMVGCEADGALFAASHIRAERADQVEALLKAWQTASFSNMRAANPVAIDAQQQAAQPQARQWTATGTNPTGQPVQARMAWWVSGADVFHVAAYAEKLSDEQTETLFTQAKIQ